MHGACGDDDALGFEDDGALGSVGAADAAVRVARLPGALHADGCLFAVDVLEEDLVGGETLDEMSTGLCGIWQEGNDGALLLCGSTAKGTVATVVLVASGVLRHGLVAVSEFPCTFGQ